MVQTLCQPDLMALLGCFWDDVTLKILSLRLRYLRTFNLEGFWAGMSEATVALRAPSDLAKSLVRGNFEQLLSRLQHAICPACRVHLLVSCVAAIPA